MSKTLKELEDDMKDRSGWKVEKDDEGRVWIYESPDNGNTIYRRSFGDPYNRELIKSEGVFEKRWEELADEISFKLLATRDHEHYDWLKQIIKDAALDRF